MTGVMETKLIMNLQSFMGKDEPKEWELKCFEKAVGELSQPVDRWQLLNVFRALPLTHSCEV